MGDPSRHGLMWDSSEEREAVRMYNAGYSTNDIATRFQRKTESIEIRLEKLGVARFKGALAAFQKGEAKSMATAKPPVYTNILGLDIFNWGTTHVEAVNYRKYAQCLVEDYDRLKDRSEDPKNESTWNDICIISQGTSAPEFWISYEAFCDFRKKYRALQKEKEKEKAKEKREQSKCEVVNVRQGKEIYYSGIVHVRAVCWVSNAMYLLNDLDAQDRGGRITNRHKWASITPIEAGEKTDYPWMAYTDFCELRRKCLTQDEEKASKTTQVVVDYETWDEKPTKRVSPSAEKRRLLLI